MSEHGECVVISSRSSSITNHLSSDVLSRNSRSSTSESIFASISDSACSGFTTPGSLPDDQSTLFIAQEARERLLFKKIIERCTSLMRVHGSSGFLKIATKLFKDEEEIRERSQQIVKLYDNFRPSQDDERLILELTTCLNALVSDERGIMIGLDSPSSLKDALITCMRIVTEPELTLEILIGLGGTEIPLNFRTPAYAVAGIARLRQLLKLRNQFPSPSVPLPPGNIRSLHFLLLLPHFIHVKEK